MDKNLGAANADTTDRKMNVVLSKEAKDEFVRKVEFQLKAL